MVSMNLLTMFAGGGGFDIGALMAGIIPKVAIEFDPEIADVYRKNLGDHVVVGRVQDIDYKQYRGLIDFVHTSPECTEFSVGKNGKGVEGEEEISQGKAIVRAIGDINPYAFSLENVWGYRRSDSWTQLIYPSLIKNGYDVTIENLCAANCGAPTKRERMIVRAIRGGMPKRIEATHQKNPPPLFGLKKWVSWYDAVEDLLHTLPEGKLPPWLIERLKKENPIGNKLIKLRDKNSRGDKFIHQNRPYLTIVGQRTNQYYILLQGENKNSNGKKHFLPDSPSPTLTSSPNFYLVQGDNLSNKKFCVEKNDPSLTIRASRSGGNYIFTPRKVLRADTRCLARWQSFPDWYKLPDKKTLATLIIGNSVPPLMAKAIVRSMIK